MSQTRERVAEGKKILVTVFDGKDGVRAPGAAYVEIRYEDGKQAYIDEIELGWINDQIRGLQEQLRIVEGR